MSKDRVHDPDDGEGSDNTYRKVVENHLDGSTRRGIQSVHQLHLGDRPLLSHVGDHQGVVSKRNSEAECAISAIWVCYGKGKRTFNDASSLLWS